MSQLTLYNAASRAKGERDRPGRSAVRPAQQLPPVMRLAFSPSDFEPSMAVGDPSSVAALRPSSVALRRVERAVAPATAPSPTEARSDSA
jgi:hypothetical protein